MSDVGLVTAEHRAIWQRDGIVHLPGLFRDWVDPLLGGIDRVIARSNDPTHPRRQPFAYSPQNPLYVSGGAGGVEVGGTMGLYLVPHDAELTRWVEASPAGEITAAITGSRRMRYWQDAVFVKTGGAQDGTPWHNDDCTWPFRGEQMAILWIALTDVGPEDAPLVTLRGTHADPWRYYSPMSVPGLEPNADYHPWEELLAKANSPDIPHDVWTVRAGDALVMHPRLIHASLPRQRQTPGRRVSFSTRWLGDDVRWAPDPYTFPIESLRDDPRMRIGAAPPDSLFPPVWSSP